MHFVNSTDAHIKATYHEYARIEPSYQCEQSSAHCSRHRTCSCFLFLRLSRFACVACFQLKLADIEIASMTQSLTEIHVPTRKTRGATGRQTVRALTSRPLPELLLLHRPLISPAFACPREAPGPCGGVSSGRCRRRPGPPRRSEPRTARTSGARTP